MSIRLDGLDDSCCGSNCCDIESQEMCTSMEKIREGGNCKTGCCCGLVIGAVISAVLFACGVLRGNYGQPDLNPTFSPTYNPTFMPTNGTNLSFPTLSPNKAPTQAPTHSVFRTVNPSEAPTLSPTLSPSEAPTPGLTYLDFTTFSPSKAPTLNPTASAAPQIASTFAPTIVSTTSANIKQLDLQNDTPYFLYRTSDWHNGINCINNSGDPVSCLPILNPGDRQQISRAESAPAYSKSGMYYDMCSSSSNGSCIGYVDSIGINYEIQNSDLTASLSNNAGGTAFLVPETGYVSLETTHSSSSPTLAPITSLPTSSKTPSRAPTSSTPTAPNPSAFPTTAAPSTTLSPTLAITRMPTVQAGAKISSSIGYLDLGLLYGQWVYGNAIDWSTVPYTLIQSAVDAEISSILNQLKKDGISDLRYSFAQVDDILNLVNGRRGDATDTISIIYSDNYKVKNTNQNFLQYLSAKAKQEGFTTTLSFGGALAGGIQAILPTDSATSANTLVEFMSHSQIDSVDFDIENGEAMQIASSANYLQFFQSLKTQLEAKGGSSTITLMGNIYGVSPAILNNINTYFTGVSLMLYSDVQYYLDATGAQYSWSLDQWLRSVGGDASKLSIGFYDSIAYENPSSSAGGQYNVAGLRRGQAAASIYLQICNNLGETVNSFAAPFWWTDNPMTLPSNKILQDFYEYLKIHSV